MKIGIFGVELTSINYGCSALGLTQLQFLEQIVQEKEINCEYCIFSNESIEKVECLKKQLNIKSKITIKKIINFRDGIKGFSYISKEIKQCDFVIDLTYGDSFSDIYGFKNYILYMFPKLITLYNRKILVIGPQTIGPYKNKIAQYCSGKVLRKANFICVRDEKSLDLAKKLGKRNDIVLTSDLAMELPFINKKLNENKFKVGINVSELLWDNSNEENRNKFGIVVDYKEMVKKIISNFSEKKYEIHLITHVYAKSEDKGEYALAKKIHEEFTNTVLAPKFESPIDAKSYISGLNLFIGARMHATIAAFSSGVPIIPTSYSRKFEGLYGSLGYNYGINLRKTTIQEAINTINIYLTQYDKLEEDRKKAFEKALDKNIEYHKLLNEIMN